jgi:hypothetical protein
MLPITTDCDFANEAREMIGGWANYSHYTYKIEEDAIIKTPQGELFARFIPAALSEEEMELATPILQAIKTRVQNRGSASAAGSMMPRVRKDGKLSRTNTIPPEVNRLLGFSDQLGYLDASTGGGKTRGTHYCRRTGLTIKHPEYLEAILPAVNKCDQLFAQELPDEYAKQIAEIEPAGRMRITPAFSTANCNRDWQTAYHTDKNDLQDGYCGMFAVGEYEGGDLVVPRYRLRFNMRRGDLIFMRPHEVHGNLPFTGERLTCVMFGREHIASCGSR